MFGRGLGGLYLTQKRRGRREVVESPFGAGGRGRFLTTEHTEAASRHTGNMVGRIRAL